MRRSTPPPPQTAAAAKHGGSCASSGASKPFASTCPSEKFGKARSAGSAASSQGAAARRSPAVARNTGAVVTPSPRGRAQSTAKYFQTKQHQQAGGLNAYALAQVKEHTMSMAQRIDQIMKVPKVDARPEMYRIDPEMEEDLRRLHEQQAIRDPELQAAPLSKAVAGARDVSKQSFNLFDAAEVSSVGGGSTACSDNRNATAHHHGSQKKHVVPQLSIAPAHPVGKKHYEADEDGVDKALNGRPLVQGTKGSGSGRNSPRAQGRLASPRAYQGHGDIISMPLPSPVAAHRTNSGRSSNAGGSTVYEFAPSPTLAHVSSSFKKADIAHVASDAAAPSTATKAAPGQPSGILLTSPRSAAVTPSVANAGGVENSASGGNARRPATETSAVANSIPGFSFSDDFKHFPSTRGASATATYRPGLRQQTSIAKFEASQPKLALPPRPHSRSPGGCLVTIDFSHDSHFTSFGVSDESLRGTRRVPSMITVDRVTSPTRHAVTQRHQGRHASPGACGNPNVIAPEPTPQRRLVRSITPPGGRRGSSGIFDPPSASSKFKTTQETISALGGPRKSFANMNRLHANTLTSTENTLKSPSLEGRTDAQHAAANDAPLKRTMSSLQTAVVRSPDNLTTSVVPQTQHVSRRMRVTSPQAMRLQASDQVGSLLAWA